MSTQVNTTGVSAVPAAGSDTGAAPAPSLLPNAEPLTEAMTGDAMSALYVAIAQQQDNSASQGTLQVNQNERVQQAALKRQLDAIQRAENDQPSGFLSDLERIALDVAKVAAVVGSVAVTVATAGAGSPLIVAAAIFLSVGGTIVSETHCLGDASQWVGLGMTLAGSAVGVGVSLGATGLSAGMQALATGGRIAEMAGGGASILGGFAHGMNTVARYHVQLDVADETEAQHDAQRMNRMNTLAIDALRDSHRSYRNALTSLQGAIEASDQTLAIIASYRG
jgi:hypothetical protein